MDSFECFYLGLLDLEADPARAILNRDVIQTPGRSHDPNDSNGRPSHPGTSNPEEGHTIEATPTDDHCIGAGRARGAIGTQGLSVNVTFLHQNMVCLTAFLTPAWAEATSQLMVRVRVGGTAVAWEY